MIVHDTTVITTITHNFTSLINEVSHSTKMMQGLRLEMIRFLFGIYYYMYTLVCGVEDQGHDGSSRTRLYVILAHRNKTVKLVDPFKVYFAISKAIRCHVCTKPSDYMISTEVEIQQMYSELASVRKKGVKRVLVARWFKDAFNIF